MTIDDAVQALLAHLPAELPPYIREQRWFRSKARSIKATGIIDIAPLEGTPLFFMSLLRVEFHDARDEVYYLPLAVATPEKGAGIDPIKLISSISFGGEPASVYEASEDEAFNRMILGEIAASATMKSREGSFMFGHTDLLPADCLSAIPAGSVKKISAEQSNTSIVFGDALIMKSYRMIEEGTNPDFDISHFLTTRTGFRNFPALLGYMEYRKAEDEKATIAMLQSFIGDADDCWEWTCSNVRGLYDSLASHGDKKEHDRDEAINSFSGKYLSRIRELGTTTARFHIALASDPHTPAFAPEPISPEDVAYWQDLVSSQIQSVFTLAGEKLPSFHGKAKEELASIIGRKSSFLRRTKGIARLSEEGVTKIRVHGDYHLGQVLKRGDDFFILDFEGEPARPLAERKAKQCALKDIAGMLRSFDYAVYSALFELDEGERGDLEKGGTAWRDRARRSFLDGYLEEIGKSDVSFLPTSRANLNAILSIYELDKAVYELNYELNNRPDWLKIPVKGLLNIAEKPDE